MAYKIGIVEAGDFSKHALNVLESAGVVRIYEPELQPLQEFITDKHALFVRLRHYWGSELLQEAKSLSYLCTPTTGLTHIDTEYTSAKKINIISLKGETEFLKTISATAEHTFGLALALLRKYGQSLLRADYFTWDRDKFKGYEMRGMNAGIIGMGRVGTQLSGYLNAFGVNVCFFDKRDDIDAPSYAKREKSLVSLVDAADIIFLCASFEKENVKMINESLLSRMKGKYFINTSRGELVDEEALLRFVRSGLFAGVALDVFEGEPGLTRTREFCLLTGEHNLLITPHIAGATYSSMWATEEFVADKLVRLIK
jgi:D-3-phosphoglycerate dehydrogenase